MYLMSSCTCAASAARRAACQAQRHLAHAPAHIDMVGTRLARVRFASAAPLGKSSPDSHAHLILGRCSTPSNCVPTSWKWTRSPLEFPGVLLFEAVLDWQWDPNGLFYWATRPYGGSGGLGRSGQDRGGPPYLRGRRRRRWLRHILVVNTVDCFRGAIKITANLSRVRLPAGRRNRAGRAVAEITDWCNVCV